MTSKVVLLIIVLAVLPRLYHLDKIPNSVSADEASFAYNAYSILRTGKDEFGQSYPLYIRSFDDYKNPVFGYFLIPFIKIFGLSVWAIRLASVVVGVAAVLLIYLLGRRITGKPRLAAVGALLGAISPWLIQYSRVAIDTEIAFALTLFGVWLFLKGEEKRGYYLLAFLVFGLSFYAYHANKVFLPLFTAFLIFWQRKLGRFIISGLIIFGLLLLPYFWQLMRSNVAIRPVSVSVFSNEEERIGASQEYAFDKASGFFGGRLVHNQKLLAFNQAVAGYLQVLSPAILFGTGGGNQIGQTRLFYLWELPLIVAGLFVASKKKSLFLFLAVWLVVGFIPGGLTVFPPFDRRILLVSFPLLVLAAMGIFSILEKFRRGRGGVSVLATILMTVSFFVYLHNYFIHGRGEVVALWGNGMEELVRTVSQQKEHYDQVVVSIKLNQPLTFFLFYEKYPPEKYLASGGTRSGGFREEGNRFDRYVFRKIRREEFVLGKLYVLAADEGDPCLRVLSSINRTDGESLAKLAVYDPTRDVSCGRKG